MKQKNEYEHQDETSRTARHQVHLAALIKHTKFSLKTTVNKTSTK